MIKPFLVIFASIGLIQQALGHDTYEITLDLIQKRSHIEAKLEMSRSTGVAASDPKPSLGVLFEPDAFPEWQAKFEKAAPELIQILNTGEHVDIKSLKVSLSREDDVLIEYIYDTSESEGLKLVAPIFSRFADEGYGVRVTFRDKSGFWHPPFMIFANKQSTPLPPR